MNVILLEKIGKIGDVGDQVNVKAGYARNYLFPFSKAIPASRENVADFNARKEELLKAANERLSGAEARAAKLNGVTITIEANAGEEGKLFGSIGTRDIADALIAAGHDIEKSEVQLPEGALRSTGDYTISLSLGSEVNAEINLKVTGSDAPAETIAAMEEIEGKTEEDTQTDTQSESEESAVEDEE
ncbi:50S ribosomal protein L9 [Haliea sp. AH-315-K21]|uniref:Large ribosomal subunit protein bL9 n=1 Tax=SAR86 cluster bacterium TaxID=2030880 RepID=A0A2A5CHL6_9GAMM|nr:50S ribosomal protein L9 [Haliea sp. AH-315-K21]MBN4075616.1 50S ribosomal protein L9 [Gammaproteobacteria bacterium AH-315-E17]PCJ43377.1 MAG: 50S ribosomal protein L9 [SAR86 cluster bacterium]